MRERGQGGRASRVENREENEGPAFVECRIEAKGSIIAIPQHRAVRSTLRTSSSFPEPFEELLDPMLTHSQAAYLDREGQVPSFGSGRM
eukprot:1349288-Amorphochlora_amoeboformis.AAC.1